MGIFRDISCSFACACLLTRRVNGRSRLLTLPRRDIVVWHDLEYWWCHHMASPWHHWPTYDVIGFPYKRRCAGLVGGLAWAGLGLIWLFCSVIGSTPGYGGMRARVDWHTGAPVLREPTSFRLSYLVHFRGCAKTLRELPGNATFYPTSTISTGPSCLPVGAHVHYLSSCLVYISGSVLSLVETIHPRYTHHIYNL